MDLNVPVFLVLAFFVLASAVSVVLARNIMHAALCLATCFVGVAGIYFLLSAELIGAAQLLIYAGAVTMVILFGIMLSDAAASSPVGLAPRPRFNIVALLVSLVFAGAMIPAALMSSWPRTAYHVPVSMEALGKVLFTDYALPNEVASVILLVALVGSIALSMKEGGQE